MAIAKQLATAHPRPPRRAGAIAGAWSLVRVYFGTMVRAQPMTVVSGQLLAQGRFEVLSRKMEGDTDGATLALRDAIERFHASGMALHAAAARDVLGGLVGGDEGGALRELARASFAAQRVVAPARFVRMYAPGFAEGLE
jgi:hypothetical protein